MSENGTFYLTLPSNASSVSYPTNTAGSYKVKLVIESFLPVDDWKVALANISFPSTVATTKTDDYKSLIGVDFPIGVEMLMDGAKDDDGNALTYKWFWVKGQELLHEHDQQMGKPRTDLSRCLIITY